MHFRLLVALFQQQHGESVMRPLPLSALPEQQRERAGG